jgi:hypothetical protein
MLRGFTLIEIYCVVLIWVSTFSALLRDINIGPVSANGAWTIVAIAASSGQQLRSVVGRISKTFVRVSWIAMGMYGVTIAVWGLGNDDILGPH